MNDRNAELLSFDEDAFDLAQHKKAADEHVRDVHRTHRQNRFLTAGKVFIILIAFVAAYLLYNLASELILQYDFNKYHSSDTLQ